MKPNVVAVIPARMESSRYPGKPLAQILGVPMVIHCLKRTELSPLVTSAVVATCNDEIIREVEKYGGKAIMTANTHVRCTDRVYEALGKLPQQADIIVLVQGDEPMVHPDMIDLAVKPLLDDPTVQCTNLVSPILNDEEFHSPNTIKVVLNKNHDFIYMSREPIPTARISPQDKSARLKQVCIMGFRRKTLDLFNDLKPTPLEILESIDMNRLIENGIPIRSVYCELRTQAVDTPADLKLVESLMQEDQLTSRYHRGQA